MPTATRISVFSVIRSPSPPRWRLGVLRILASSSSWSCPWWLAGLVPGCQAVLEDECVEGAAELAALAINPGAHDELPPAQQVYQIYQIYQAWYGMCGSRARVISKGGMTEWLHWQAGARLDAAPRRPG